VPLNGPLVGLLLRAAHSQNEKWMATYILSWNPAKSPGDFTRRQLARFHRDGRLPYRWRTIRTRRFPVGSRAFVVRAAIDPKGIVASGWTTGEPYRDDGTWFVSFEFDVVARDPVIRLKILGTGLPFRDVNWLVQGSGVELPEAVAAPLESLWRGTGSPRIVPGVSETAPGRRYAEGALKRIQVNAYERDNRARRDCIAHYGARCVICGFDFGKQYGPNLDGFIEVHHLRELSNVPRGYRVDPIRDLRPLCSNCHAALRRRRWYAITGTFG